MLHTDTSNTQATNRASCHASHRYQSRVKQRKQTVNLTMLHTGTSKSQATNPTSCRASHILPCLTHIPANHKQQIVLASQT